MSKDNGFVAMATKQCPVCGAMHKYNTEILIHKKLRNIDEDKTFTGHGLCKEHSELFDKGYTAFVSIDLSKSTVSDDNTIKAENAYRTGRIIHIRKEVFSQLFNIEVPENLPMQFIDDEAADMLEKMYEGNSTEISEK